MQRAYLGKCTLMIRKRLLMSIQPVHATIEEKEGLYDILSHGSHGTSILRRDVITNILVGRRMVLEDGDGNKLATFSDPSYRLFIYTWSLPNDNLPKNCHADIALSSSPSTPMSNSSS